MRGNIRSLRRKVIIFELAPKSVLSMMGYTVAENKDPGSAVRRQILALIIDNNILTKYKIKDYLNLFIVMHKDRESYYIAVSKWESDLEFVSRYTKGTYTAFGVQSIKRKTYHY